MLAASSARSCSSCCSSHLRVSDQTHALLRELRNPAGAHIILETERRPAAADAEGGEHRMGGAHAPPLLDKPAWTKWGTGVVHGELAEMSRNANLR